MAGAGGTVSEPPESVAYGDEVTVTATPDEGMTFFCWVSDNAGVDTKGAGATFTFEMPKDSVTLTAMFTATVTGAAEGDEINYAWYLNGAETPVVTAVPNYDVTLETGYYSMKLVVTDVTSGRTAEPYELVNAVKVGPKTLYVVSGNEGVPPYETWETAAGDIQTAVDEALAGAEIVVSNGVYRQTAKVLVEKVPSKARVTAG